MRHTAGFIAPSPLEAAFHSGDENRLVKELRKVRSQKTRRQLRALRVMRILKQTSSHRVRNAAAIALADMRAQNAKNILIEMLTRSETKGSRGTLLYALEELRATVPLSILVDIVINDPYEASEEAVGLIADEKFIWSKFDLQRAKPKLRAALESANKQRSSAAHRALKYLSAHE